MIDSGNSIIQYWTILHMHYIINMGADIMKKSTKEAKTQAKYLTLKPSTAQNIQKIAWVTRDSFNNLANTIFDEYAKKNKHLIEQCDLMIQNSKQPK